MLACKSNPIKISGGKSAAVLRHGPVLRGKKVGAARVELEASPLRQAAGASRSSLQGTKDAMLFQNSRLNVPHELKFGKN